MRRIFGLKGRSGRLAFAALVAIAAGVLAGGRASAADASLGKIVAVDGDAWIEPAGGARRALACGDAIGEGDRVVTAPGARVGLQAQDVFAQIEGGSEVTVTRGKDGAPKVAVNKGNARVRRMDVAGVRKGKGHLAPPGECAQGRNVSPPVAVGPGDLDRLIGDPADRFTPTDVAAGPLGPPGVAPGNPVPLPVCIVSPCATGGSSPPPPAPPALRPIEQPGSPALPPP
jgi:hypothetical protein